MDFISIVKKEQKKMGLTNKDVSEKLGIMEIEYDYLLDYRKPLTNLLYYGLCSVFRISVTDVTDIPNKIEPQVIESLMFTDEELAHISEQYIAPIYAGLSEEKFSKVENSDGSVRYVLTLTNAELKDIFVNMLQTLSTDTMMYNEKEQILLHNMNGIEEFM